MLGRRPSMHQDHGEQQPTALALEEKDGDNSSRAKGVAFASHHYEGIHAGDSRSASMSSSSSASSSISNLQSPSYMDSSSSSDESARHNTLLSASSISAYSMTMTSTSANTTHHDRPGAVTLTTEPPSTNTIASTSTSAPSSVHAHPSLALLALVSNSASSSALPDRFDVNVSRKGGFVAVYSASHLWLIKTEALPRLFARTLQVKRRPIAVDVTEDGCLLAVLSRPLQVDLYEIHGRQAHDQMITKRRTISLVHEATSVVISPDARILITGNKFGIEVVAIGPQAPETARRTLSAPAGDGLEFSDDGRTLLITGYARKSDGSALFVLPGLYDGPLTEEGEPIPQPPEAAWTGSVLFPESARTARQATLLPDADTGTFSELFAFNAEEDSWGIYDIACQRFTPRKMFLPDHQPWTRSDFLDDAMPAVSPNADLAAVALRMRGTTNIWVYDVPGWDYKPSSNSKALLDAPIKPCFCIPIPKDDATTLQEICALRWLRLNAHVQRLVAVGNSTVLPGKNDVPDAPLVSKGLLVILDFDKRKPAGSPIPAPVKIEYDLDPLCPGERLPEGSIPFDREVELVRTRTMAQHGAQDQDAALARRSSRLGSTPVHHTRTTPLRPPQRPRLAPEDSEELTPEEAQAMFEAPYDNQQPRSHMSLARAATVAAASPANRQHLRALPSRPLEYRRADGTRELPHESDADNWVPPPPAYTPTAAAAGSVSLSHPNVPPVPRLAIPRPSTSSNAIPPVPSLPDMNTLAHLANFSLSNAHSRHSPVASGIPISPPLSPRERERRPSLLHPSTYPSPQSYSTPQSPNSPSLSPRRCGSANPTTSHPYPANPSHIPSRRPISGGRRAVESSIDVRPPPLLNPDLDMTRRGSAPTQPTQRRPTFSHTTNLRSNTLPPPSPSLLSPNLPHHPSTPRLHPSLPRLTSPSDRTRHPSIPRTAPPRSQSQHLDLAYRFTRANGGGAPDVAAGFSYSQSVPDLGARVEGAGEEVRSKGRRGRRVGCVVM